MATDIGKVQAEVVLELNKLKSQLKAMKAAISSTEQTINQNAQQNQKQYSGAWQAGFAVVSLYGVKAANAIKNAFMATIGTFADFEQSIANVASIVGTDAVDSMDELEAAARRVGATTRSTASDAADALYYLASAGFDAKESIAALEGVNALAIATNSDLARTSEIVATTVRQYGLETAAATDIANTFTAAITNSLATMDKLGKSFEYVGPIAAGLGLSVEETTAALQLLYNKGFSGEKAGRGLRTILVNLADATSIVNKRLARLGITFDEVNPATNELGDIFDTLREKGVDATNAAAIFGKVSGAQLQALISTASDAKGGIVELEEAVTGTNRAFEAMDIQMDTLQGSFDQFKNATEALEIQTGKGLEPVLRLVVDTATDIVRALGELSPSVLALGASLGTLTGVSLSLAAAIVAVGKAVGFATLGLGPIAGIIAGIGVAIIGMSAAAKRASNIKLDNFKEEFKDVIDVANETDDAIKETFSNITKLTQNVKFVPESVLSDATKLKQLIENWADAYNLTNEQVIKVLENNTKINEVGAEALATIRAQYAAEQELANEEQLRLAEKQMKMQEVQRQLELEKQLQEALQEQEDKRAESTAEAQASLTLAFERAIEYQKLLGDEYDRNTELTNAFKNSISLLIDQGLEAESDEVQNLIKLYSDLQSQYGKVYSSGLSDTEKRIKAQEEIRKRLKEIAEEEKLALLAGQEYSAEKERQAAVLNEINSLIAEGFTVEGAGIQKILEEFGPYIGSLEKVNELAEEYKAKAEELKQTELEKLEIERLAAIEKANGDAQAIAAINEYYGLLQETIALEERDERIANVNKYKGLLQELNATEVERLELQREAALETVKGFNAAEEAVNDYYDALVSDAKLKQFQANFETITGALLNVLSVLNDAIQLSISKQIEAEEEALQKKLDLLDEELQAELEAAGVAEETTLERLQRELAEAIATGDAEQIADAQAALKRYQIQQEYLDKKEQAELETQKKIAQMEYEAALSSWGLSLAQAIVNTAAATIGFLVDPGGYAGIALAAIAGITGAAEIGVISANKPEPPKFNDGGVVPGSATKGDITPILANAGEIVLNAGQQKNVAEQLTSSTGVPPITINHSTYLDGKVVAQNSATYYNNGRVKLRTLK